MSGFGQRFGPINRVSDLTKCEIVCFAKNYNLGQFQLDVC